MTQIPAVIVLKSLVELTPLIYPSGSVDGLPVCYSIRSYNSLEFL